MPRTFEAAGVKELWEIDFDNLQAHVISDFECDHRLFAKGAGQVGTQQRGFPATEQQEGRRLAGLRFPAENFRQDAPA